MAHLMSPTRREQYYWVRYWYWVILGCFSTIGIGIGIGIVKGFSKYWYWYWELLRAFQSIGIGYCQGLIGNIGYWYWGKKVVLLRTESEL